MSPSQQFFFLKASLSPVYFFKKILEFWLQVSDQTIQSSFLMNEESEMNINFDFPHCCYFVLVGGKYLNRIGDVMEKVNSVVNDIGVRPEALFLISNSYKENINIDMNYDFEKFNSTPVMVDIMILNKNEFLHQFKRFKFPMIKNRGKIQNIYSKFTVQINIKDLHTN